MHELPITRSILEIALRHAAKAKAGKITGIYLVIGQLSSFLDNSIQFYWDIVAKDTIAGGAQLHFKRISTELVCLDCNKRYGPNGRDLACPYCEGTRIEIVSGKEFYVEAIDVE